jgi:preprotein translocase subunit SecG
MNHWLIVILAVHIVAAIAVVSLVLLQHGKGADVGAAFGSGASGSLFGASGSANFLSRATAVLAAVFFLTSLGLAYVASNRAVATGTVMEQVKPPPVPAPAEQAPKSQTDAPASRASEVPK